MGDHTEAVQVDFDPEVLSLTKLVDRFWQSHSPIVSQRSVQYRSAIWYADAEQLHVINASKLKLAKDYAAPIQTTVAPLGPFYRAEDYHQKHGLQRNKELMEAFNEIYPEFRHFVDSTAAARLNGSLLSTASTLSDEQLQEYGDLAPIIRKLTHGR